jgi:predicted nucleic acid-binding protein
VVIHLDTSFLIDLMREHVRGPGPATRWLEGQAATPLAVSVFVHCELEAGAANAAHPSRERERVRQLLAVVSVVSPGEAFASTYGATWLDIQRRGKSISTMDLLIAAIALENAAPLLTANRRHFDVVADLAVLTYR